jgi:hypothetical protein
MYLEQYEAAKKVGDADLVHKLRSNVSATRKRINYYKAHIEEAKAIQEEQERLKAEKTAKAELKKAQRLAERAKQEERQAKVIKLRELEAAAIKRRYEYLDAKWNYGENHFATNCAKAA